MANPLSAGAATCSPLRDNGLVGVVDEAVRSMPAPALRPFIAYYSGYRQAGVEPGRHRGLPSPYLTLIFTLDDPLTIAAHPDPWQLPSEYGTLLGGLHTSPALITHQGWQSGIQLALSPLGARPLLGLPAGELAHADFPADDVLGPLAAEIHDRVRAAGSWPERFAAIDRLLLGRLQAGGPPGKAGRHAAGGPAGRAGQRGSRVRLAEPAPDRRHRARFRPGRGDRME